MSPGEAGTIWTVGHGARAPLEFLELLRGQSIGTIADVRRVPQSRRHPHFGREALARSLEAEGIRYRHFERLGGMRTPDGSATNAGWPDPHFRGCADYMQTPEFAQAIDELAALGRDGRTAILCAEADPMRCHRQLIADALVARGWSVAHIVGAAGSTSPATKPHSLTRGARVEGIRVTYPANQLGLDLRGGA